MQIRVEFLMKIRHLNKCANLSKCSHRVFELNMFFIYRKISFYKKVKPR